MSHFVLVPGAWHGAWAWERVVPLLDSPEFDDDVRELAESNGWAVEHLDAGHWPMLSEPVMLVEALLRYA